MLIPKFKLDQDDTSVTITIFVPNVVTLSKAEDAEYSVDGHEFLFFCSPYLLRLALPGKLEYDQQSNAQHFVNEEKFVIRVKKSCSGMFPGLDMLTALLKPSGKSSARHLVSEVDDSVPPSLRGDEDDETDDTEWWLECEHPKEHTFVSKYGFANLRSNIMDKLDDEMKTVFDIHEAEGKSAEKYRTERESTEAADFSDDHYLADLMEPDEVQLAIKYEADWEQQNKIASAHDFKVVLTGEENETLLKFQNKEYVFDAENSQFVFFGLIDILYAYAYDVRTTLGEGNCMSGWAISKLSSTLSWLDTFHCIKDVVKACLRRSLTYPRFRNWDLSMKVLKDTHSILKLGREYVLKCLLSVRSHFLASPPRNVLNELYINDYCVWIQKISSQKLISLAEVVCSFVPEKDNMELELCELEYAAKLVVEEDLHERVMNGVRKLELQNTGGSGNSADLDSDDTSESDQDDSNSTDSED